MPLSECSQLCPGPLTASSVDEQWLLTQRLKIDERARDRRTGKVTVPREERRSSSDRREEEDDQMLANREQREHLAARIQAAHTPKNGLRVPICLVIISGLIFGFSAMIGSGQKRLAADCHKLPGPGVDWSYCKLQGVDLTNIDMTGAILHDAKLERVTMMGTTLIGSHLDYAVLYSGNLGFVDMTAASLKGVDFRGADLSYAKFQNADLSYADLSGANIGGADFTDAKLDNAIWVNRKTCQRGSVGQCRFN